MNSTHVKPYPDWAGKGTPYPALDGFLGCLLLLCALVGIPGNISGALFFSSTTETDWVALLYTFICSVDTITSFSHLPVAVGLFRGRKPGPFSSLIFCAVWDTLYSILQKISIFLVLVISSTRTLIIINPLYKIRAGTVKKCVVGYLLLLFLIPVLQYVIPSLRGRFIYSWDGCYCYYDFEHDFEHVINLMITGLPPILTFCTLMVTIYKMSAKRKGDRNESDNYIQKYKRDASITIALLTALFLMCNLPLFINLVHNMTTTFFGVDYPGVYMGTRFMFWYSWHIAKMESVVLNAALNPVLYFYRMRKFRAWWRAFLRRYLPEGVVSFFISSSATRASDTAELKELGSSVRMDKYSRITPSSATLNMISST